MIQSFGRILAPALVLGVLSVAVPMQADTVLYSTSFESPTFTTGPISGQNGWGVYGPSTPTVENYFAKTGSQAVFVDGGTTAQSGPYHTDFTNGPLVQLSADVAIFTSSSQTEWQFGGLGSGLIGFLGGIDILADNTIHAITAGKPQIGTYSRATGFNSSAWHNISLLFNIATQTYNVSLDGVLLDANIPFCDGNVTCTGPPLTSYYNGIFDSFGTGNDSGYMDNYTVTVLSTGVPEPSTVSLLLSSLLVVAGIGLWRRYRALLSVR